MFFKNSQEEIKGKIFKYIQVRNPDIMSPKQLQSITEFFKAKNIKIHYFMLNLNHKVITLYLHTHICP